LRTLLNNTGGEGVETYYYPGSVNGHKLANSIHEYVIKGTSQKDRGVKTANFHVLRETTMPACLIEFGFMDDPALREARLMINEVFQKECAVQTAQGICEYFEVKYVPVYHPVPPVQTMYDLSYLKDYELIGIRSSRHPSEINEKVTWAMTARANCTLLLKRGFDLRHLQKALNEMYPPE
jgi:hypothetical protein